MFWIFGDSGFPFLFLLGCHIDLCLYLVTVSFFFFFDLFLRFWNFGGIVCVWEADWDLFIIFYFNRFIWISLLFSLYYFIWSKYLLISFESWASYLFLNGRASQRGLCIWRSSLIFPIFPLFLMALQNNFQFSPCLCNKSNNILCPNFFLSFSNRIINFQLHVIILTTMSHTNSKRVINAPAHPGNHH